MKRISMAGQGRAGRADLTCELGTFAARATELGKGHEGHVYTKSYTDRAIDMSDETRQDRISRRCLTNNIEAYPVRLCSSPMKSPQIPNGPPILVG